MSDHALEHLKEAVADRYSVQEEIGRGGMAVVYLAEDLKHRRKVAVKVLSTALASTIGTERFLREIEVIAGLQHPHILTLIDSGEVEGLPYYVMPYVEGQSLRERLEDVGALPVEEAVRIASEVADALHYAHGSGVIHRDVKPGNVLLSGDHAVVADFGIAAALDEAAVGRLTATGVSLGSPAYMSPEQASGSTELDGRTDVYALGCVLYEMLSGRSPFAGPIQSLLTQKVLGKVEPVEELRPDLPAGIIRAVHKAMESDADGRFQSAAELRDALRAGLPREGPVRWGRRPALVGVGAVGVVTVLAVLAIGNARAENERLMWARQQLAEVEELAGAGRVTEALALAEEVGEVVPHDTTLARLLPAISFTIPVRTDPPGAEVWIQEADASEDEWELLGTTPLEEVRFAGTTFESEDMGVNYFDYRPTRVRFELDGHQPRVLLLTPLLGARWRGLEPIDPVELLPDDPETEGMVPIPGFTLESVRYADYLMDRYEVTNAEFKAFVDDGGYRNPEYWEHPFVRDGEEIGFEEAIALFKDQTGRPGPSTWRLGTFPEGRADYPVGGVSWYEAAAYGRWAGKELPTRLHWAWGRRFFRETSHAIVPRSNLGGDGPRPVGRNRAMTALGVYDLVGNVREWLYNPAGEGRRGTMGGSWTDPPFAAGWTVPRPAFDRDPTLGFRLVRTSDPEEVLETLRYPVQGTTPDRDYWSEEPASDAEFAVFRRLYDYDPVPLNASVERTDTAEHWVREIVALDLPYGERGRVALYLPRDVPRPLQPVLLWSGSGIKALSSVDEEFTQAFDFMVRSGRAVVVPILAGTYGRPIRGAADGGSVPPRGSVAHRDLFIEWVKDFRTTLDYLETREDVSTERVGYFGFSWGGATAPVVLVVEPRIDAAVLNVGGLTGSDYQPEVDPFHFVSRVRVPLLMISGEDDTVFPYETYQRPMFELLGTDPEHKEHYVTRASHLVPRDEVITQTLDWFDRYLGPAGGG